jgi:hypothetical protein
MFQEGTVGEEQRMREDIQTASIHKHPKIAITEMKQCSLA